VEETTNRRILFFPTDEEEVVVVVESFLGEPQDDKDEALACDPEPNEKHRRGLHRPRWTMTENSEALLLDIPQTKKKDVADAVVAVAREP